MAELVVSVDVEAPARDVWQRLVDWETHGEWMLLTAVRRTTGEGDGIGAGIEGITGVGPLVMRDSMTFTQWAPPPADPARCVVEHTGNVVRGSGSFEVESLGPRRSRITWSEWVRVPLGVVGEAGFLAVRPLAALFLRVSLRRLARLVESAQR